MGALPYTAVLVLQASPWQMGVLAALRWTPGLLFGMIAGVWVDRLHRRPILMAADFGRFALLATIPAAYLFDLLRMEQLYVVAFGTGTLTIFFDVAYRSYLPSLVSRSELVDANSKLTASSSVVEVTAFSIGGWISQLVSAIAVVIADAVTFLLSGIAIALIRRPEKPPEAAVTGRSISREILEGLSYLWRDRLLRAFAMADGALGFAGGIIGALILLFAVDELGIPPGVVGTIFAVGGFVAIFAAIYAERFTRRWGIGPVMIVGLFVFAASMFFIPAATGPLALAIVFLVVQQFGDGPMVVQEINQMSVRQAITPERMLGRVNGSMRFVEVSAMLAGSLAAGLLGETIGLRLTLLIGASAGLLGAFILLASPVRRMRDVPVTDGD
jgi:MFS family permease